MKGSTPTLIGADRRRLKGMFAAHEHERVIIDAILQRGYGSVLVDSLDAPDVALLQLDSFSIPAGDPDAPTADDLVRKISGGLVVTATEAWRRRVLQDRSGKVQTERRTAMSSARLDLDHVRRMAGTVAAGYEVRRIGPDLIPEALGHLSYSSDDEFLQNGFGFCGLWGEQIVSRARTYIDSNEAIEVAIIVEPEHRGKGMAKATAAALVQHSLELGYDPHWTATNATSVRVAQSLGYAVAGDYELIAMSG